MVVDGVVELVGAGEVQGGGVFLIEQVRAWVAVAVLGLGDLRRMEFLGAIPYEGRAAAVFHAGMVGVLVLGPVQMIIGRDLALGVALLAVQILGRRHRGFYRRELGVVLLALNLHAE